MTKRIFSIIFLSFFACLANAQSGLFLGPGVFGYKSNFYNADDVQAKKELDYITTYNASYGFEIGYRFNNNWSISLVPQKVRNNQKYKGYYGVNVLDPYNIEASASTDFIKIPIYLQYISKNESKLKWMISFGAFYSRLLNYSDEFSVLSVNNNTYHATHKVFNKRFEQFYLNQPNNRMVRGQTLSETAYHENFVGASFGSGIVYQLNSSIELVFQAKSDYTINDLEKKTKIDAVSDPNYNMGTVYNGFSNMQAKYSAYKTEPRAKTHLFNLGFALNARFFLHNSKAAR